MDQNTESSFENLITGKIIRRTLLPWWIKICCWIFMIMGILAPVVIITGLLGLELELSIYGFKTNQPISIVGILIITILIFKGFTAYSLWFEKDNAINLSKIDALCGIALCIISMFVMPFVLKNSVITFRLELLFLIMYFRKVNQIEYQWDNQESQ